MTDATPRVFQTSGSVWLKDFEFGLTGLTVRKTGARVPYSPSVIAQVTAWFRYFFAAQQIERLAPSFTIAFTPERARPWYLIWAVARAAGAKLVKDAANADVVMHFEDATYSPNDPPTKLKPGVKLVNFSCRDVSKTNVARACAAAFGHPLAVDPTTHAGPAVEKSEINAAHDGRIVQCPAQPIPGRVYQRVIDNRMAGDLDFVEDLRTSTVGGRPAVVFVKRRQVTKRFLNTNTEVLLRMPEEVFSAEEIEQISAFTREIGLEWGGVDVLRDRTTGKLYIVDANKTDMGPPIALNLADKIKATYAMRDAFRKFVRGE
ncbi:MAG TPA: hypothetical protein VEA80_11025 [Vitreimonas sp.]|uniref:hypothetical protein n=1 Tax=Vitreimonas sp. TaxID=3069702 RepID=UPI002D73D8EA|nr:hypothetical protein [Vitreimonas sp.]HYD87999.1 hypothetical protein [Vitreimonas sp.]